MNEKYTGRNVAGLLLALVLSGCSGGGEEAPGNCLLITLDTIRADALSCYVPGAAATPNLDGLAARGLLCESCYSPIPITLPAHAAVFYSRLPHQLGVYNNGERVSAGRERECLPDIFEARGYATAAFVSMGVLQSEFGLDRGFSVYEGRFPRSGRYYFTAGEMNDRVLSWLDAVGDTPFFLWVHYSDPHAPYHPPGMPDACAVRVDGDPVGRYSLDETRHDVRLPLDPGRHVIEFRIENPDRERIGRKQARFRHLKLTDSGGRDILDLKKAKGWVFNREIGAFLCAAGNRLTIPAGDRGGDVRLSFRGALSLSPESLRENYRREVEYLDEQLGRLLDRLETTGLAGNTHVLVVGDHGEGLGEYLKSSGSRHFGHIRYLYDVYLRVPFLIRSPRISEPGRRLGTVVGLLDVAPTILDLMEWASPPGFLGRSVLSLDGTERRSLYQSTFRPESDRDRFGLLEYPLHMILTPAEKRVELYDLVQDSGEKTDIYPSRAGDPDIQEMRRRLENGIRRILRSRRVSRPDSRTEEMLRALGYIR